MINSNILLTSALNYAQLGYQVFPCRNKKPLTRNGFKDATKDPDQIKAWWSQFPNAQIGAVTGKAAGFFVLDIDIPDGPETLKELELKNGPLPSTAEQRTGSGGRHLFFKSPGGIEIKNSVRKLGPGLDIRGDGGYIIMAPSVHENGNPYEWVNTGSITPAPDWLINLITQKPQLPERTTPAVINSTSYGVDALDNEAIEVSHTPEGSRNDRLCKAAFKMGMLVHRQEVDETQVQEELLQAALTAGLSEWESARTIKSGLSAGKDAGRNRIEELFVGVPYEPQPVMPASVSVPSSSPATFSFLPFKEMIERRALTDWLIRKFFDLCSLILLFGETGTMKSFLAIDIGLCIATGRDWHGNKVMKQGAVFYICGEGFAGLFKRLLAWIKKYDVGDDIPFYTSNIAVDLSNPVFVRLVVAAVRTLISESGQQPVLIIVDTLNRNFGEGDENSTADMTRFLHGLDCLKNELNTAVMVVHHTGLQDRHRARGSSTLKAAVDFEYRVTAQDDYIYLDCTKIKDHEPPEKLCFKPEVINLGFIEKDDPDELEFATSVVLNRHESTIIPLRHPLTQSQQQVMDALCELIQESDNDKVHIDAWRAAARQKSISDSPNQDSKRKAFNRCREGLLKKGYVSTHDGYYWPQDSGTEAGQSRDSPAQDTGQTGHTP